MNNFRNTLRVMASGAAPACEFSLYGAEPDFSALSQVINQSWLTIYFLCTRTGGLYSHAPRLVHPTLAEVTRLNI
jgi:hypothetical protein